MAAPATFHEIILDAQLDAIQNGSILVGLCKNYLRSDDFTATSNKVIASLTINSGHAIWGARTTDESPPGHATAPNKRQALTAVLLDDATDSANGTSDDLALVLLSADKVLCVTDETSDRPVTTGDKITTFAWYVQATQPTTV